jgi:hypothetical protein
MLVQVGLGLKSKTPIPRIGVITACSVCLHAWSFYAPRNYCTQTHAYIGYSKILGPGFATIGGGRLSKVWRDIIIFKATGAQHTQKNPSTIELKKKYVQFCFWLSGRIESKNTQS